MDRLQTIKNIYTICGSNMKDHLISSNDTNVKGYLVHLFRDLKTLFCHVCYVFSY